MTTLRSHYGGLVLNSPLIVGACSMTLNDQSRRQMEQAGAGAIVLPSLFEEQIAVPGATKSGERKSQWGCPDVETYLSVIERARADQSIPVIASLNGGTDGDWIDFASELEAAGASAVEFNLQPSYRQEIETAADREANILAAVGRMKASLTIPLHVKLQSGFTSLPHISMQLLSGCQGLVLFGRQPELDIHLDTSKLVSRWNLTPPDAQPDLRPLMQVHGSCPAMPLAASGGINHAEHLIKCLLAGADVGMVTSAIYRKGPEVIQWLLEGVEAYLQSHKIDDLGELRMRRPLQFSREEDRSSYMTALASHLNVPIDDIRTPAVSGRAAGQTVGFTD